MTTASTSLTEAELAPIVRVHLTASANSPLHYTLPDTRHHFDLNPPYQRGSVWDVTRRQLLIRSLLAGIPTGAIIINDRLASRVAGEHYETGFLGVIDGKQRIETLRAWVDGQLPVPASWFQDEDIETPAGADGMLTWDNLTRPFQRNWMMRPLPGFVAQVPTIEAEAEIFRRVNTGGVDQTADDLARAAAVESASTV